MKVIKVGGTIVSDPQALRAALDTEGPIVVVHGAGPQLDQVIPNNRVNGLRITPESCIEAFDATVQEAADAVTAALQSLGRTVRPMDPLPSRALPELGRTGTVVAFPPDCRNALAAGETPLLGPRGWDGALLNVNADDIAQSVAIMLQADELVMVSSVGAVLGKTGNPIAVLSRTEVTKLMEDGTASGGMVPKLKAVEQALGAGVRAVRITAPGHLGTCIS